MAVKDFSDLMQGLLAELPAVYVAFGSSYHRLDGFDNCAGLKIACPDNVRRIPLDLAKWLGYEPCGICKPDKYY